MYCLLLLILLFCSKAKSQDNVFTINKVSLQAFPQNEIHKGVPLILNCSVDISKNEHFRLNYTFSFFKDGELLFTNTVEQDSAQYTISRARFSSSGQYECSLSVEEKKKFSDPLIIKVEGIMKPELSVLKTEVMEGENVLLRCELPEEKPPLFFTFYKTKQSANGVVHDRKRISKVENFVELEFPIDAGDSILNFECAVQMNLVTGSQASGRSNRTIVTVSEPFSVPKITIDPPQNITEGDKICITCSTVLLRQDQTEIILQKNKTILNSTKGRETLTYCKIVKLEDNGNYICTVEHGSVSKTSKEELVVTELFSKPMLVVNKTKWDENSIVQIQCQVNGPMPISLSLIKDNKILINSNIYTAQLRVSDSGIYMCRAEINNISKESDPVFLHIYAPVSLPVLSQPFSQVGVLDKFFVLQCYSKFGTLPITYSLYRGNIYIRKIVTEQNVPANFTVKATSIQESGQYRCHANNGHSLSQQSNRINVTIIAPVANITFKREPEENIEDGNGLVFFCSVASGSFPIEFHFFKENDGKSLHQVIEKKKRVVSWAKESFTSQDEGSYFCRADNQAKSFVESQKVLVKVVMASWKKGLIITAILLIFLAAIITIIWLNCRSKANAKSISTELAVSKRATNSVDGKRITGQNNEGEFYYGSGYNEDGEKNHISAKEDNRGSDLEVPEVEYTEVQVSVPDPYRAPVTNNETVYTEIRKTINDAGENRHSRIEPSPDGT
ncbi:platelet endothelial cell adhesion molecule isoform X1 [Pseudonaja textilis]|uniref:platelet endothelial cell adhesion molecule isoform X1 n=1 Tax=Pseudonaja textilis TaxID=8673 RepID=UPI000EA8F506|nr:platelet endothelial cell adhesion molecule isoform X1 [Pseudonaja textilis]